jgi:uncharacterized protein YndB with AHSA1/START domain
MTRGPTESVGAAVGSSTVRIERVLPGPIERVWAYLVDPEKRAKWLAAGAMDLRVDAEVDLCFRHAELSAEKQTPDRFKRLADGDGSHNVHCRITACEPPHLLRFTWGEAGEVTFELTPRGDEVLLVVIHSRLPDRGVMISVASGWHAHLAILIDRLHGREPRGFWSEHAAAEAQYERVL